MLINFRPVGYFAFWWLWQQSEIYDVLSGENALFPDVANIALAKRPQQALTVENLSLLIFLWKLSGLTHRNISQQHKSYIGAKAQPVDMIHQIILRNPKVH